MVQPLSVEESLGGSMLHRGMNGIVDQDRRVLFFPYGNHVEHASFYLEHAWEEPPKDWYSCVQFALVLWNVNDPSIFVSHGMRNWLRLYGKC